LLRQLTPVLPPSWAFRQLGSLATASARRADIEWLLAAVPLDEERRTWLRTLLLTCEPLGRPPAFTARELTALLPVLDPLRDVLREYMGRGSNEEGEAELRVVLYRRLREDRLPVPPPLSLRQRASHFDWIEDFRGLDGWELFGVPETELPEEHRTGAARPSAQRGSSTSL
jgi:hypothetical protein